MTDSRLLERRAEILNKLEKLYADFEQTLLPRESNSNPCGSCRECCTGLLNLHNVTQLERDFIADRVGPDNLAAFAKFTDRGAGEQLCPFFDEEIWGCGVYHHRPFSCRVFGHHRAKETRLPEVCVFRGQEAIFAQPSYYQSVPLAGELRDLVREFWPYESTLTTSEGRVPSQESELTHGDELDRALQLQTQGKLQEALVLMAESDLAQTPYSLYCVSLILEGLGRHADAVRALDEALVEAGHSPILQFRRACNLLAAQKGPEAMLALRRTLELSPEHVQATTLLGGQLLQEGRTGEALEQLKKAAELDPQNTTVRRLLAAGLATQEQ